MTNDHDMRIECAERLTKLEEGRQANYDNIQRWADNTEKLASDVRAGMKGVEAVVRGYHAESMKAYGELNGKVVKTQAKADAAHARLDFHQRIIWGIVGSIVALAGGVILWAITVAPYSG